MNKVRILNLLLLFSTQVIHSQGEASLTAGSIWTDQTAAHFTEVQGVYSGFAFTDTHNSLFLAINAEGRYFPLTSYKDLNLQGKFSWLHLSDFISLGIEGISWVNAMETLDSRESGFTLSLPLTWNAEAFSLSFSPDWGMSFSAENLVSTGSILSFATMWGEWVWNPKLGGGMTWGSEGLQEASLTPSLRLAWYPGFPLSSELASSVFWQASEPGIGGFSRIRIDFSGAATPWDQLMASLLTYGEWGQESRLFGGSLKLEYLLPMEGNFTIAFPLTISLDFTSVFRGSVQTGVTINF